MRPARPAEPPAPPVPLMARAARTFQCCLGSARESGARTPAELPAGTWASIQGTRQGRAESSLHPRGFLTHLLFHPQPGDRAGWGGGPTSPGTQGVTWWPPGVHRLGTGQEQSHGVWLPTMIRQAGASWGPPHSPHPPLSNPRVSNTPGPSPRPPHSCWARSIETGTLPSHPPRPLTPARPPRAV